MAEKIGLAAVMDMANFSKGMNDYNSKLDTASGNTDKKAGLMSKALGAIGGGAKIAALGVVGLAGAAVGAVGGIAALVLKTAASSDELAEMSDKTGIGVERLQELKFIGEQTGTGVETVTGAIARLTRGMGDAVQGTGTAGAAFETLGISVTNADGTLRDAEVVFGEALTALGSVGNETERDALAMEIFGRSAKELNPLIKLGAEGMAEMSQQARDMGAVLGEDTVQSMADVNDRMAALKAGLGGVVSQLAGAFLPIFEKVLGWMEESLMPFFMGTLVPWIQDKIPKALQVLSDFWSNVLQPAIQAVWSWMSTVLIPFLQGTVRPWLEENIPKALQFLADIWTGVLQPAISAVWNWMSTVLIPFLQTVVFPWLQEHIPQALQTLANFWTNILQPAIQAVWNFLTVDMMPVWEALGTLLGVTLKGAIDILVNAWNNVLKPALEGIWNFITSYVVPAFQEFLGWVGNVTGGIQGIANAIQSVINWVSNLIKKFKELINAIPDIISPGSPTPFEIGLRGIGDAIQAVTTDAARLGQTLGSMRGPQMGNFPVAGNLAYARAGGYYSANREVNMNMNPTINNGMDLAMLRNFITQTVQEALL